MKPGETVQAAVYRAVKEELGLGSSVEIGTLGSDNCEEIVRLLPYSYVRKVEECASSLSPGLPTRYVLHTVEAEAEGLSERVFSTEEGDEYGGLGASVADSAVSCKKYFWKWVDSDSV